MQASSEALSAKCLLAFFRCMQINQIFIPCIHKTISTVGGFLYIFTTFASKNNCIQDKQLLSYGIDT